MGLFSCCVPSSPKVFTKTHKIGPFPPNHLVKGAPPPLRTKPSLQNAGKNIRHPAQINTKALPQKSLQQSQPQKQSPLRNTLLASQLPLRDEEEDWDLEAEEIDSKMNPGDSMKKKKGAGNFLQRLAKARNVGPTPMNVSSDVAKSSSNMEGGARLSDQGGGAGPDSDTTTKGGRNTDNEDVGDGRPRQPSPGRPPVKTQAFVSTGNPKKKTLFSSNVISLPEQAASNDLAYTIPNDASSEDHFPSHLPLHTHTHSFQHQHHNSFYPPSHLDTIEEEQSNMVVISKGTAYEEDMILSFEGSSMSQKAMANNYVPSLSTSSPNRNDENNILMQSMPGAISSVSLYNEPSPFDSSTNEDTLKKDT